MENHYDIIIVGTGAGGSTLAHKLADSGKKILILERGGYIPIEKENWDSEAVFIKNRYTTNERWLDKDDNEFQPGQHYNVGGNTKLYGAALFRMRESDFEEVIHHGGISPKWPISYADLKDFYLEAETLYDVHGERGTDPTDPSEENPYPLPPLPHEPRIQEIFNDLKSFGLHPFPLPIGVNFNKENKAEAPFILDRFDGFPDPTEHKADAHVNALRQALSYENVELWINAHVQKLYTNEAGNKISKIELEYNGKTITLNSDLVILSCGAINSSVLLLKSANEQYPNGLANSSGVVGRNYMFHNNSAMIALSIEPNPTRFGKTLGINDYYHKSDDFDFPLGHIQMLGKSDKIQISADSPVPAPGFTFELMAKHAVDFWLASEDLPDPNNRITYENGKIKITYTPNNLEGHHRLMTKLKFALQNSGQFSHFIPKNIYFAKDMPIAAVAHQNGTVRFGTDPKTSALDIYCRSHDINNLFVVDGSFFVSSSAVNPALTIIAMALRVGDYIKKNL
ncbi:GMC oxidoreductase [Flavobacterium sp. 7A]|uniref:GMC oxidoreductase n=1 Tax=Flavobacterium sp. 7A TaxID=2940571 RepID=UPI002227B538|nr:GMC family oxidoreductase [Flavobacterium sp. 7A]MCW2120558.1 choline dehydrogenase-like flavoprotein [Flavobacterium sp. 7A]